MMGADTKKMYILLWKYTIIRHAMSIRLVEGGLARVAGQSCLAGPSVLQLHPSFGHCRAWEYGREPCAESQVFFCGVRHFESTLSCEPRGGRAPTRIVPSLTPTHRPQRTVLSVSV